MKVFGTGWQRTGTTSLGQALNDLGIRTRQYPWQLLDNLNHPVIRRFDGFCDNPIPLVYRDLDRLHPASKFIHTTREEEGWAKSVYWLMTTGAERFRWDQLPKGWEMIERLYGTCEYDEERLKQRYRRHNAEVLEYFSARPDDLLVVDLTRGDGFDKICPFLGLPIPDQPFPHRNTSAERKP